MLSIVGDSGATMLVALFHHRRKRGDRSLAAKPAALVNLIRTLIIRWGMEISSMHILLFWLTLLHHAKDLRDSIAEMIVSDATNLPSFRSPS